MEANKNNTVETIKAQLLAQGINPKLTFVKWDENTLKVSRGANGSMITYNESTDLYDVTEYHEFQIEAPQSGIMAGDLLDAVMPSFSQRRAA